MKSTLCRRTLKPLLGRMIPSLSVVAMFGAGAQPADAAKFLEARAVDEQTLMVAFKDGEVFYRDDGIGPEAYYGHAHPEDQLVAYGDGLNVEAAADPENWRLSSKDDPDYVPEGVRPVGVFRKSKVNNTDHDWNYKLDHWIFLELPAPLKQGCRYELKIDDQIKSDASGTAFVYDIYSMVSEAVHVNIIGTMADGPIKSADLYLWLGDGGPRDYSSFEGNDVFIIDQDSGEVEVVGQVTFWKKSAKEMNAWNLTGSDVWNADFSSFNRPGRYRLAIEGVGASPEFRIADDVYYEPLRTSVRGFYYMRIGERGDGMVPIPRRPLFIPGEDPEGFVIYKTDLQPYHEVWAELRKKGDVWDEPHFKEAEDSIFWEHRLAGNPINPNAVGGHADAMDWDRHLGHVSIIYDLLLPYFLTGGAIGNDDLGIPESGNGIPDLIDEARNEVDFWLSLRDGEAYAHGLTNPDKNKTCMFQAGVTTIAAWANAANCAMLADCLRLSGHNELASYYTLQAEIAYTFATGQPDQMLEDSQEVGGTTMRGRDFRMTAAAFLYNLTGKTDYEDVVAEESVVTGPASEIEKNREWGQLWATAAYLKAPRDVHYPDLQADMRTSIIAEAMEKCVSGMKSRPSRKSSVENWFQTMAQVQRVILAHAVSEDEAEKERLLASLILEADWTLGRNPMNRVEMTGLGSRHIEGAYTTGGNDGTPGLHPGHTPYMNLGSWGGTNNGSHPEWFSDRGYPAWVEGGWPHQEAYFDCRYSWANSEFTPQQTMRGKTALYAYLYALGISEGL